jgi:serine/threonine protein kinase
LTFGAVLAEVSLVLSVLSKQDGPVRVPPISTLHRHPILGYGKSFTARLVPSSSFGNILPNWNRDENVVVKSLRHREILDPTRQHADERILRLENFLRELRVLTHEPLRNHENIARLIGVGWERNRLSIKTSVFHWPFLVLEHAPYGNLSDFLENHGVDFDTRRALCLDVGMGLQKLHQCDVIHGDMKLENVLVSRHPTRKYVAKIADFGFTIFDLEGNLPTTKRLGYSEPWEAPESASTLAFRDRQSTDTYSYGFLIWKCLSYGHHPFDEAGGAISNQSLETIKKLKATDGVPEYAVRALKGVLDNSLLSASRQAFQHTVRLSHARRSLDSAVKSLM